MLLWTVFIVFILFLLALDLGVFNKDNHVPTTREALKWTSLWATVGVSFTGVVYWLYNNYWTDHGLTGVEASLQYLSGYLVELSLSMDNVFVMALIFKYFKVPSQYQHRVLFWGILGALFFRAVMIFAGVWLLEQFQWTMYVFAAILLYSVYQMFTGEDEVEPDKNPIIRYAKKVMPVTKEFHGEQFFIKRKHIRAATPLFIALLMIETTDILFAFDSIPAILAITKESFLVFSSNVFAILGLRSLYFVLAAMMDRFELMKYSLAIILIFVALKMILHDVVHLPAWASLAVIFTCLAGGVFISLYRTKQEAPVSTDG